MQVTHSSRQRLRYPKARCHSIGNSSKGWVKMLITSILSFFKKKQQPVINENIRSSCCFSSSFILTVST